MYTFSFEKLDAWQNAKTLSLKIYSLTKAFPSDEKFGLISQMRRASISIASNLAEGNSRNTKKDKAHFTTIAYSSLMELLNQIIISKSLNYIKEEDYNILRTEIAHIANQLNSLRKYQLNN